VKNSARTTNVSSVVTETTKASYEEIISILGIKEIISKRLSSQLKFTKRRNISEMSTSRLYDLRKIAKSMALRIFEYLSDEPEEIFELLLDDKENVPPGASELMQTNIVQELKRSFLSTECKSQKCQILSVLVSQFTRAEVSKLLQTQISTHEFRLATLHQLHWGSGLPSSKLPFKHLKYSRQEIEEILNFILHHNNAQALAYGEKRVLSSVGDVVNLISFQRRFDIPNQRFFQIL
jgi:hypothetical protein